MPFDLAKTITTHLVIQPADLALNPPESYFYVLDGLIISCGVFYALCYFFYMLRTVADGRCAGFIEFTAMTQAYELYYAFVIPTTTFEFQAFLIWFLLDFTFFAVTLLSSATPPPARLPTLFRSILLFLAGVGVIHVLTVLYPSDNQQLTAYWTGLALQFPIGWGSLWLILKHRDTRGHSLEIWMTRYLGCWTAYGVFWWRWANNPEAWGYVGCDCELFFLSFFVWVPLSSRSHWVCCYLFLDFLWEKASAEVERLLKVMLTICDIVSWWVIGLTMLPETIYPFVYVWIHFRNKGSSKIKTI